MVKSMSSKSLDTIQGNFRWTKKARIVYELEQGFSRFGWPSKNELALSPLSQEWADHPIECQVPPWNMDEYLIRIPRLLYMSKRGMFMKNRITICEVT